MATGTTDNGVYVLDSSSGKELWSYRMPAAGSAPPTTYVADGVQYIVVNATGGSFVGFSGRSDKLIAFALGKPQPDSNGAH